MIVLHFNSATKGQNLNASMDNQVYNVQSTWLYYNIIIRHYFGGFYVIWKTKGLYVESQAKWGFYRALRASISSTMIVRRTVDWTSFGSPVIREYWQVAVSLLLRRACLLSKFQMDSTPNFCITSDCMRNIIAVCIQCTVVLMPDRSLHSV